MKVFSKNISTSVYEYQDIIGSTFTVPIGLLDLGLYESDTDLSVSGFGVCSMSSIYLIPNIVIAGDMFSLRVYPVNGEGANFVYLEADGVYFVLEFTPFIDQSMVNPAT